MLTQLADKVLEYIRDPKVLEYIRDPSADFVVVVEGEKDRRALERLGVKNIAVLNRHGGVFPLAEALAERNVRRVVILTDFDRTGRFLAKKLALAFYGEGIHVDWRTRREIHHVFGIRYVETLDKAVEEMRGDLDGKNLHRFRKIPRSRKD